MLSCGFWLMGFHASHVYTGAVARMQLTVFWEGLRSLGCAHEYYHLSSYGFWITGLQEQSQQPPQCEEVPTAWQPEKASLGCKTNQRIQEDFQALVKQY